MYYHVLTSKGLMCSANLNILIILRMYLCLCAEQVVLKNKGSVLTLLLLLGQESEHQQPLVSQVGGGLGEVRLLLCSGGASRLVCVSMM